MIKEYWKKIVKWYKEREPQDYYDPFAGIAMEANSKHKKTE